MNSSSIVLWMRKASVITFTLVGLVVIVAVGSSIRDSRPKLTDTPAQVPSSPTDAATACRVYGVMKTRLDQVARISDLIPRRELVTAARQQEFEDRRDGVKRENAERRLSGRRRLVAPADPYFDEIAIMALNERVDHQTVCHWIRDNVKYMQSVRRVYGNYVEAQANALPAERSQ